MQVPQTCSDYNPTDLFCFHPLITIRWRQKKTGPLHYSYLDVLWISVDSLKEIFKFKSIWVHKNELCKFPRDLIFAHVRTCFTFVKLAIDVCATWTVSILIKSLYEKFVNNQERVQYAMAEILYLSGNGELLYYHVIPNIFQSYSMTNFFWHQQELYQCVWISFLVFLM